MYKRVKMIDLKIDQYRSSALNGGNLKISYLFGIILSVAASVIASLLMLSGDIEENPGPSLDYDSVDATQELSEDDLIDVLEALLPIKSLYFALGRSLRLKTADLRSIQTANPSESDAEQALSDTLELWLQRKYNVEKVGPPTWRMLVEAVDRKGGGNNPELAKNIAAEHPATATPVGPQSSEEATLVKDGHQPLVPVTDSASHSCPSEQSSGLVLTSGATQLSLQVPDEADATTEWILKEEHLTPLISYIESFSQKWYSIGMGLGFTTPELEHIKAMPSLFMTAPKSYLIELLSQWVQWPTKKHPTKPTLGAFCSMLREYVHLGSLAETVQTGMKEAVPSFTVPDDDRKVYKKYLMSLYAQLIPTETSLNQWHPPPTRKFFRLALIKGKAVQRGKIESDFVRQTIKGSVEDILREKHPIELEDIFKVAPDVHQKIILFEGAPGSGKSTLSTHIVLECSQGKLYPQYELIILVRLRDPEVQKATNFSDLLPNRDEEMRQRAANAINSSDGQGVLFVFDGWDELPLMLRSNSIFYNMIFPAFKKLHNCTIIVTSRPIASAGLRKVASTRIEILGFPPATLKEYFTECLNDDLAVAALLGKIKENPVVASYCSFPLIASILVHIFECQNELPTTQYGIFSELILTCIYRHCIERGDSHDDLSLDSFEQLPEELYTSLMYICGIAYKGILDDEITFCGLHKEFDTLSLLNGTESMLMRGKKMYYSFIHLSVQEFLAAYHITKLADAEQVRILDELFGQPRFVAVFQFYAAISKFQTPGISDIIAKVARRCIGERYSHDNKRHLVVLLSCLFESQNSDLCTAVASHLDTQLQLDGITFTPLDCFSVNFFLANTANVKVDLNNCSIRGDMVSFLFRSGKTYNLQDLELIGNKMGDDGAKAISSGMSTMVNLQKLSLSDNKIGDEGARHIACSMHSIVNLEILESRPDWNTGLVP